MATSPDATSSALPPSQLPPVVRLNVGGLHFTAALGTLRSAPGSRLSDLFGEPPGRPASPGEAAAAAAAAAWEGRQPPLRLDEEGRVFLDRDGRHFGHVLAFLREGATPPAEAPNGLREALAVHAEATFWGLEAMARALEEAPALFGEMVARRQFCAQVPSYRENIEIMIRVARAEALASRVSRVLVHVNKSSEHELHDHHHHHHDGGARRAHACSLHGEQYLVNFGPWSVEPGVRDLLDCVKVDVEALGYRVTWEERLPPPGEGGGDRGAGLAGLFRGPPAPPPSCGLYEFLFHWW
uniref:BTB/POZ domain-containing protein KCTD14-like n=1 Tax=Petromyzon marinus TaxID=7757 RepID=A0AAJ7SKP7_PETMA|nr:BTB/POZ domain-containing protein KCTD14-like [Petromyzon marinus]